jgi:integrase
MATNKLTETSVRGAKPRARQYKLSDGEGLYLLVTPGGSKLWRLKFRTGGKEKVLALGAYPSVSLGAARKARQAAKDKLAAGLDPAREKQLEKYRERVSAGNTFGEIAKEFLDKRQREGLGDATKEKSEYYLTRLSDVIRRTPIDKITAPDLLAQLRKIEAKGNYETARRVLQLAGRVFRYAVATARLHSDPSRDLKGALTAPRPKHFSAITDSKRVGELLRAIDGFEGQVLTKIALQLSAHVFVRPGELRKAEWSEIDFDKAEWNIPAAKMKMRRGHSVPLSRQVLDLLRRANEISGPDGFVFPSVRTRQRPMSENTVTASLRRLGFSGDEMTAHGFRAMASTLLNESLKWSPDAIERALAHGDTDKVRSAYHRGAHWKERVAMAQWWSDHLDTLRQGAEIVPLKRGA